VDESRPRRAAGGRSSRTDEIQHRIKQMILEQNLTVGDPMPTEFELIDELDVSRNSLREALKALQAVGIVEIRHGLGTYVGRMSMGALVDELTFHGRMSRQSGRDAFGHLIEVREILERGLVDALIERRPDVAWDALDAVMAEMNDEARNGSVNATTDRRFHELLYEPLANPLVDRLLGAFWDVFHALQHDLEPADESPDDVAAWHRDIYHAIRAGDREAASVAMTRHFEGIRRRADAPVKDHR